MGRVYKLENKLISLSEIESIENNDPPHVTVHMRSGDVIYGIDSYYGNEPKIMKAWKDLYKKT